jgi:multiple sugar transport system permease protein
MTATLRRTDLVRRQERSQRRQAWLLVLPALVPVAIFSVYPLIRGIYLGFTDTEAGFQVRSQFTGFRNYTRLLHDSLFWQAFRNGLVWAFSITLIQFCLGLGLALLLDLPLRLRWLARTLALVPWAMPPVIVAIMWRLVYHPDAGILNEVTRALHITHTNVNWLGGFSTAFAAVVVVGVWPQLRPVIIAITSLDFVWNFNSFGLIYVLTDGGPGGRTTLPMLFAYNEAFKYGHFGYAAAMGNAMVLIIVAILALYLYGRLREVQ